MPLISDQQLHQPAVAVPLDGQAAAQIAAVLHTVARAVQVAGPVDQSAGAQEAGPVDQSAEAQEVQEAVQVDQSAGVQGAQVAGAQEAQVAGVQAEVDPGLPVHRRDVKLSFYPRIYLDPGFLRTKKRYSYEKVNIYSHAIRGRYPHPGCPE